MFSLHKISVLLLLSINSFVASAQPYYRPAAGARETGMAQASVVHKGFWSSFHNQALLSGFGTVSAGFNYENRFGIKELGTRSAALIIPAGFASLGAIYSGFGYPDFKREMIGIGCGLPITEKISAGIQIDYLSERTAGEYLNNKFITCEAGLIITASNDLIFGFHIFNPVPNSLREFDMPAGIRAGLGTKLNSSLFAAAEVEMYSGTKPGLNTGMEYEAAKNFMLRAGYRSLTSSFSFGLGYIAGPGKVDIAFLTHERLGITSSLSIIFEIKQK